MKEKRLLSLPSTPALQSMEEAFLVTKQEWQPYQLIQIAMFAPFPSKFNSGGISRSTRESIIIFKAAGYDYIFVETVGVGQTEYSVREVSDFLF